MGNDEKKNNLLTVHNFEPTINPMENKQTPLEGQTILITGSARRLGKVMALAAAKSGADIILHHSHSATEAEETAKEIRSLGQKVWVLEADLSDPDQAQNLITSAFGLAQVTALINNAAIFKPVTLIATTLEDWNQHMQINLTAPFLLSQAFAARFDARIIGRILDILDWRALRPGKDHFPYTISKSALAAMTQSMALSLAPRITVNGIALGAVLPPQGEEFSEKLIKNVPMQRWSTLDELGELVTFLLSAPAYITGEIIHLDGGRHLV
jgi:NAD(P)-dependent dehydrogenase (short-subunit alcohol dehydrogenase family)